ncbi:MAG: hypothetical protein J3K34DRAFT_421476 [Monoraphidium minutum]|nr:MAG: hypothetical protein J3K34DRAFT_421476 [Monoraphidium minutum]
MVLGHEQRMSSSGPEHASRLNPLQTPLSAGFDGACVQGLNPSRMVRSNPDSLNSQPHKPEAEEDYLIYSRPANMAGSCFDGAAPRPSLPSQELDDETVAAVRQAHQRQQRLAQQCEAAAGEEPPTQQQRQPSLQQRQPSLQQQLSQGVKALRERLALLHTQSDGCPAEEPLVEVGGGYVPQLTEAFDGDRRSPVGGGGRSSVASGSGSPAASPRSPIFVSAGSTSARSLVGSRIPRPPSALAATAARTPSASNSPRGGASSGAAFDSSRADPGPRAPTAAVPLSPSRSAGLLRSPHSLAAGTPAAQSERAAAAPSAGSQAAKGPKAAMQKAVAAAAALRGGRSPASSPTGSAGRTPGVPPRSPLTAFGGSAREGGAAAGSGSSGTPSPSAAGGGKSAGATPAGKMAASLLKKK